MFFGFPSLVRITQGEVDMVPLWGRSFQSVVTIPCSLSLMASHSVESIITSAGAPLMTWPVMAPDPA